MHNQARPCGRWGGAGKEGEAGRHQRPALQPNKLLTTHENNFQVGRCCAQVRHRVSANNPNKKVQIFVGQFWRKARVGIIKIHYLYEQENGLFVEKPIRQSMVLTGRARNTGQPVFIEFSAFRFPLPWFFNFHWMQTFIITMNVISERPNKF